MVTTNYTCSLVILYLRKPGLISGELVFISWLLEYIIHFACIIIYSGDKNNYEMHTVLWYLFNINVKNVHDNSTKYLGNTTSSA